MAQINSTLLSLRDQSRKADVIYLNIPRNVTRLNLSTETVLIGEIETPLDQVIEGMKALVGPTLVVQRTADYGPATKLLGALEVEKDPETIIITVDDDCDYHHDMVLLLTDGM
ncbi:hypothetical protein HDU76_005721, partial [Blyttiomyces sp. JEL0837]